MELIKVEIKKLLKKKSTKVFLILYGIILAGITTVALVAELVFGLALYHGAGFIGAVLATMMGFLLPLMTIYLSSSSQALDMTRKTMKNMYLLPISRTKLYISKIAAVQFITAAVLGIQFVVVLAANLAINGTDLAGLVGVAVDHIGAFLILGLVNIIGNALTLLVRNTGLVIILAYVGFVGLNLLAMYFPAVSTVAITTLLSGYAGCLKR